MGVEAVFNHADFRLLSDRVLDALSRYRETNLYLRGLVPLVGFKSVQIGYRRERRMAGCGHYPFLKMLGFAVDGITSLTVKPIRIITFFGAVVSVFTFAMAVWSIVYAPGSTFKPVTALAALNEGIPDSLTYECTGVYEIGEMKLRCARRWGHGPENLRTALRDSCNPYFCNLAMEAGTNALVSAARALGLGQKTGIDFGVDMAGVVPDDEWKRRQYGCGWYVGDLAQMSIGQSMLLVSPLQMARLAGAIGTGYLAVPRLKAGEHAELKPLPFREEHLRAVREGMELVTSAGSARSACEGVAVKVAGKTGTAEVGTGANRRNNTWFIAYAPADRPTVAIAMVIERGESGGSTTAPKVGNILRGIFNG